MRSAWARMRLTSGWRYMRWNRNALMSRSAAAIGSEKANIARPRGARRRAAVSIPSAARRSRGRQDRVLDEAGDDATRQFVDRPRGLEPGMQPLDLGRPARRDRALRAMSSSANRPGAQAVVDVVRVVGDVVGERRGLRFERRKVGEIQRLLRDHRRGSRPARRASPSAEPGVRRRRAAAHCA